MGAFKNIELEKLGEGAANASSSPKAPDFDRLKREHDLLERNRKFSAVFRVARSIDGFERRIQPHIDQVKSEVTWQEIEAELKSGSEEIALHWMKAFWTGEIPQGSKALSLLWLTDCKIKEAIVCAVAESTFSNYVLTERYRTPKGI